ncbi:MAG: hypothetical protein ABJ242_10980 [Marinomonas sp.]
MRHSITSMVAAVAIGTMCAGGAAAQFGGLGSAIKREANKKRDQAAEAAADEIEQAITGKKKPRNSRRGTSSGGGNVAMGTPSKSLTDFTKCSGLPLENMMIGRQGDYTFQQGFSKESRRGFINRRPGNVIRGCVAPSLQSGEILYFEVDTARYKAMNKSNDWKMQCVKSNNPGGGTVPLNAWAGQSTDYLKSKDLKLHCGNDQGVTDCASGTNSKRGQSYSSDLKKRGRTAISFMARYNDHVQGRNSGKLYCQFYNKRTSKSLVAFEMMFENRPGR